MRLGAPSDARKDRNYVPFKGEPIWKTWDAQNPGDSLEPSERHKHLYNDFNMFSFRLTNGREAHVRAHKSITDGLYKGICPLVVCYHGGGLVNSPPYCPAAI